MFRWWLPPGPGRKAPYLSSWHMTAADAAQRGALRPEPSTRRIHAGDPGSAAGMAHLGAAPRHGHRMD